MFQLMKLCSSEPNFLKGILISKGSPVVPLYLFKWLMQKNTHNLLIRNYGQNWQSISMVVVVMWNCNFCEWVPLTIAVELIPGLWNTHRSHNQVHAVTYHHLSSSIPGASLQLYCIFGYCELGEWTTFPFSRAAWSILRSKLREMLSMNMSTALYALNV